MYIFFSFDTVIYYHLATQYFVLIIVFFSNLIIVVFSSLDFRFIILDYLPLRKTLFVM